MSRLCLYHQMRKDNRARSGLEIDGQPVAEVFDEGGEGEYDPILLWFIDVRCEGSPIPGDPEAALDWLEEHTKIIRDGLARCSQSLEVGLDADIYPLIWTDFGDVPSDVKMSIACSASRRFDARSMAALVNQFSVDWPILIEEIRRSSLAVSRA